MLNKFRVYLAEGIGTFALCLVVVLSLQGNFPVPVPVMAALTLGLFVYSIGHISGTHINPAITIGLLSIKKIVWKDALGYLAAQCIGALLALGVSKALGIHNLDLPGNSALIALSETIGTFFFSFGIAAVVSERVPKIMSGAVVGGSLLLGVVIASSIGSAGILNPAVELAVGMLTPMYVLGSILGAVLGFNTYVLLDKQRLS